MAFIAFLAGLTQVCPFTRQKQTSAVRNFYNFCREFLEQKSKIFSNVSYKPMSTFSNI